MKACRGIIITLIFTDMKSDVISFRLSYVIKPSGETGDNDVDGGLKNGANVVGLSPELYSFRIPPRHAPLHPTKTVMKELNRRGSNRKCM